MVTVARTEAIAVQRKTFVNVTAVSTSPKIPIIFINRKLGGVGQTVQIKRENAVERHRRSMAKLRSVIQTQRTLIVVRNGETVDKVQTFAIARNALIIKNVKR